MSEKGLEAGKSGTIFEHLNELAARLKIVLYSLFLATTAFMVVPANSSFLQNPFAFYDPLIAIVLRQVVKDVLPTGIQLIAGEFTAPLEIYLIASVLLGIAVSAPVIAYEVYQFIDPALYPEERRAVYPFVGSFSALFLIGTAFGYKILAVHAVGHASFLQAHEFPPHHQRNRLLQSSIHHNPGIRVFLHGARVLRASRQVWNHKD